MKNHIRRRQFITLLGGAAAALPRAGWTQQPGSLPHFIYLAGAPKDYPETQARLGAFRTAFEKLGWVDGRNVRIDYRWDAIAVGSERAVAAELVRTAPAVILITGTPMARALRLETRTVPIVFAAATDPLGSNLVDSMARPGENLTGFANYLFSFGGKWLEMLKEAAPATKRVLVILLPGNLAQQGVMRVIETAGTTLGVQPVAASVRDAAEIQHAVAAFAREPNGGLLALPGNPGLENAELIIGLAAQYHLPLIYPHRFAAELGSLMTYDTDHSDLFRRSALYVDRILKGVRPGDLPVQLPTRYDLVINLKTAKALGLTIPLPLLASADEIIE
jgi:putative tryptophan/tyrosine transport system substrate-binding protein